MRLRLTGIFALIAALQSSCSTRVYELNLSEYPNLPSPGIVHATRAVVKSNKPMRDYVLWGNYGGPGSSGGKPIDAMDQSFLEHDLAYLQGVRRRQLIASDQRLITQLEALDTSSMPPKGEAYRQRAIRYFKNPISRVLGKPMDVLFGLKTGPAVIDTSKRSGSSK